jgi:hypothetical protein
MHRSSAIIVLYLMGIGAARAASIPAMPMPEAREDGIRHRWLAKPVRESRLLDGMEDAATWSHHGLGTMKLSSERVREGKTALLLESPTKGEKVGGADGRPWGAAIVQRDVPGEDWRRWNRLSLWVFPDLPGFRVVSLCLVLRNDGAEKVPNMWDRNGRNFVLVENGRWNQVVWEIAHLPRDRVTGVEISYRLQGNEPGATERVRFHFDGLEIQEVVPDHFEGWDVAPEGIAYSHGGYVAGSSKTALASGLAAGDFELVDASSGAVVLRKAVEQVKTPLGDFARMDFSAVQGPGRYVLKAGDLATRAFAIGADAWRGSIVKTVNFFYCERCGDAVPGIHDACHRDWACVHGDRKVMIAGGWHDAGDLSQGLVNTSEAAYAMMALADALRVTDAELSQRLAAEAMWGLDWILKTRFGDGFRCTWATMDFWTDGILGTVDDVTSAARRSAFDNFLASSTEALASRALRQSDPIRSAYCLAAARQDFDWAAEDARQPNLEVAAAGLNAALDLHDATKEQRYADSAVRLAAIVVGSQQVEDPPWDIPLKGFFYTAPDKRSILHYSHRGHEQAPVVGLVRLCTALPGHADFARWDGAIRLYAGYYEKIAEYTAPWYMLPAGIYRTAESDRESFAAQVRNGVRLAEGIYLRCFPVWFDFRGNCGTVLSQTKGLAAAGRYLKDERLLELCRRQIEWNLGRNPFCQSLMYGEGYDFAPQYTAMSGDMVGSLPVGIETRLDADRPYWPADNCYNFKEVWVHPSARWLSILVDLYDGRR